MSRRYPPAEVYEDRERDSYARPRTERNYEELDVDITRSRFPDRADTVVSDRRGARPGRIPDFLRDDYGKTAAGPLVVRAREDDYDTYSRRGAPERVERDELVIRERDRDRDRDHDRDWDRDRERKADRPRERERERERPPPPRDYDQEEIIYRRGGDRDRDPPPPTRTREREREEIDINIRHGEVEPPRREPPPPRRTFEREDIVFRRGGEGGERRQGQPPPRSEVDREEIIFRHREETRSPPARSERGVDRDELIIRDRERSLPPPRHRSMGPVAREREEFVFRRREPSSPPPPRDDVREEIIIRRRERSPIREPSPEPLRMPSPEPLPEPIIRPPIVQEIITHHRHIDHGIERVREPTPPPPPPSPPPPARDDSLEIEIRRRGTRNGERYDEDIIIDREKTERRGREQDVEITRRRSVSNMRGARSKKDMWTEVTKDLVIKEAIDEMGYDYEETADFFYVIDYLRYEDVLRLVELSEEIRRERRERIREIQWEREEIERLPPAKPRSRYDERVYEREVDYYRRRG